VVLRVVLDAAACTGHGRCYSLAPEVFDADAEGHCVVLVAELVTPDLEAQARLGVDNCPERALRVQPA
jgi:ferredoxin